MRRIGSRPGKQTEAPKDARTGTLGINYVKTAYPDIFSAGQAVLASWRPGRARQ
jgi:hypothetical protein